MTVAMEDKALNLRRHLHCSGAPHLDVSRHSMRNRGARLDWYKYQELRSAKTSVPQRHLLQRCRTLFLKHDR